MAVNTAAPRYQALPRTVTAGVLARAVVAAARAYGDDPERAMTSGLANERRALTAAVSGVADAVQVTPRRVAPLLGISNHTVEQRRRMGGGQFQQAARAAQGAAAEEIRRQRVPAPPPGIIFRAAPPAPQQADRRALAERILEVLLNKGAASPMTLAFLVDAKELVVSQALLQLQQEGRAVAEDLPIQGRRAQLWKAAAEGVGQ